MQSCTTLTVYKFFLNLFLCSLVSFKAYTKNILWWYYTLSKLYLISFVSTFIFLNAPFYDKQTILYAQPIKVFQFTLAYNFEYVFCYTKKHPLLSQQFKLKDTTIHGGITNCKVNLIICINLGNKDVFIFVNSSFSASLCSIALNVTRIRLVGSAFSKTF